MSGATAWCVAASFLRRSALTQAQAMHPTEKAFRPSHRAGQHGCIIHDASYLALIEISGALGSLSDLLVLCCDPQGQPPGAQRLDPTPLFCGDSF